MSVCHLKHSCLYHHILNMSCSNWRCATTGALLQPIQASSRGTGGGGGCSQVGTLWRLSTLVSAADIPLWLVHVQVLGAAFLPAWSSHHVAVPAHTPACPSSCDQVLLSCSRAAVSWGMHASPAAFGCTRLYGTVTVGCRLLFHGAHQRRPQRPRAAPHPWVWCLW
jgi:hypothetical protein